jgi:CheY-like chemotaxis protein
MKKPIKKKKPVFKFNTALLVDDNELDNFINQKIMEGSFFAETIYTNTSGASALELLKNFSLNQKLAPALLPEVIFIDINMPFMDGIQFINQFIKLFGKKTSNFKLVVLTSSINPEDKKAVSKLSSEIIFLNKPLTNEGLALIV